MQFELIFKLSNWRNCSHCFQCVFAASYVNCLYKTWRFHVELVTIKVKHLTYVQRTKNNYTRKLLLHMIWRGTINNKADLILAGKRYPVFLFHWHPAKAQFEWRRDLDIKHSFKNVLTGQYFADFFIRQGDESVYFAFNGKIPNRVENTNRPLPMNGIRSRMSLLGIALQTSL